MDPQLIEKPDQPVLCIRTATNTTDLYPTVDALSAKLWKHCTDFQITPTGVIYTAYSNFERQNFDLEVGLPTDIAYPGVGEIVSSVLPAGTYVQCLYQGPYRKMRPFYAELEGWLHQAGYQSGPVNYERYLNTLDEVTEAELLTEVMMPVVPL
jgi:effector-binding domain-containing protein